MAGVDDQVDDHLLDLTRVDLHLAEIRMELGRQEDVLAQQTPQHLFEPRDDGVDVHHLRLHGLAAGEGEELFGEGGRPLAGLLDARQVAGQERVLGMALEQQVAVAEDRQQAVVEVVGHAGRQAADGLHLRRVQELALEHLVLGLVTLAPGDVADRHHRDLLALEDVVLARDLDVHGAAAVGEADALPGHALKVHLAGDQFREPPAEDLLRLVAEDPQQGVVDLQDDTVADDGNAFESRLEQSAEALLAPADGLLGGLALGDLRLRFFIEANVLHHGRDLVGHRRQQVDVDRREEVVRVTPSDQPDADRTSPGR